MSSLRTVNVGPWTALGFLGFHVPAVFYLYGSALGFSKPTNHSPGSCVASTEGYNFWEQFCGRKEGVAGTWNHRKPLMCSSINKESLISVLTYLPLHPPSLSPSLYPSPLLSLYLPSLSFSTPLPPSPNTPLSLYASPFFLHNLHLVAWWNYWGFWCVFSYCKSLWIKASAKRPECKWMKSDKNAINCWFQKHFVPCIM